MDAQEFDKLCQSIMDKTGLSSSEVVEQLLPFMEDFVEVMGA